MEADISRAAKLLSERELTLCLVLGDYVFTSEARGVAPLLELLDGDRPPRGFFAADRVVGRGAAYLYVLLGASHVYAKVLSRGAREVLCRFGIGFSCDVLTDSVRNRAGDGPCPIEAAVAGETEPMRALFAIRKRLSELQKRSSQNGDHGKNAER